MSLTTPAIARSSPAWRQGALAGVPFHIIGESPAFRHALACIERVARSDAPLLIEGETGSGKEVAARAVHYGGPRAAGRFVPINCGAVPDALFEAELFGHERGAFTDARERRHGLVTEAEGGTLFLDEVDALAPKSQVALLRFLQDLCFRPLGSVREQQGDVRLVAASNRPLEPLVAAGAFRQDLLYRLKVLHVTIPPLRERGRDAALLAEHFAERFVRKYGDDARTIDAAHFDWVVAQPWPGNIRELENWVHRKVLVGDGAATPVAPRAIAQAESGPPSALPNYREAKAHALTAFECGYLKHALQLAQGNVSRAAALAGKERRAFGKLLKKHGIERNLR